MELFDLRANGDREDRPTESSTVGTGLSRRRFLGATGTAAVAGLAGCNEVTQQSFEAAAVELPTDAQDALALGETVAKGRTVSREGPGGTEVKITSQVAVYRRPTEDS